MRYNYSNYNISDESIGLLKFDYMLITYVRYLMGKRINYFNNGFWKSIPIFSRHTRYISLGT